MKSSVYSFLLLLMFFGVTSKNSLFNARPQILYLWFLQRVLVLALAFRSMIHLELIFVYDVWKESVFVLLHIDIRMSQYHLLTRLFYPHWIVLAFLLQVNCHQCKGLFLDSQFSSVDLCVYCYVSTTASWLLYLGSKVWN